MKICEVVASLNSGKTIVEIAKELSITKETTLEEKLNRAAVYYNQEIMCWEYVGEFPEKSLSRDITSRIDELQIDKPFIRNRKGMVDDANDVLFNVFKDYQSIWWADFNVRKTVFFQEDFYSELKKYSVDNKLKLNVFINILIKKGLEAYKIK